MSGLIGIALLVSALVLLVVMRGLTTRPVPPAWTQGNLVMEMVATGAVGLIFVGIALILKFGAHLSNGASSIFDDFVLVVAAFAVVGLIGYPWYRRRHRRDRAARHPGGPATPAAT